MPSHAGGLTSTAEVRYNNLKSFVLIAFNPIIACLVCLQLGDCFSLNEFFLAGKSTYIRSIALLTVMAMAGCFIPAEYASFK